MAAISNVALNTALSGVEGRNASAHAATAHVPIAYRVADAVTVSGISRTCIYDFIKSGSLRSVKIGSRRLILRSDLEAFIAGGAK